MRTVWVIAWHDLQVMLQNKETWLLVLALPAIVIYLAGLGAQGVAQRVQVTIRMDVLDQDRSTASQTFIASLAQTTPSLVVCSAANPSPEACALADPALSLALAHERLAKGVTYSILTIPVGFAAALEKGDQVSLLFESDVAAAPAEIAFWTVQNVASRAAGPVVAAQLSTRLAQSLSVDTGPEFFAARLADATAAWGPPPPIQVLTEYATGNRRQILGAQLLKNGFMLSTPSITAMFVMISILGLTQALAEERMIGIVRRMAMLPVSRAQFLAGKLLQTSLMGLLQCLALLAFGSWLGVDFGANPLSALLVAGAYVLAVTGLALALAAVARSPRQASGLATCAWMVLVPLGGGWWPLTIVPHWLQSLGHLSPVAWFLDALASLIFDQGTMADALGPLVVLVLFALGFFALAVRKLSY